MTFDAATVNNFSQSMIRFLNLASFAYFCFLIATLAFVARITLNH